MAYCFFTMIIAVLKTICQGAIFNFVVLMHTVVSCFKYILAEAMTQRASD